MVDINDKNRFYTCKKKCSLVQNEEKEENVTKRNLKLF
jgi:hypothetical protein